MPTCWWPASTQYLGLILVTSGLTCRSRSAESRLRPMRGLKRLRSAQVISAGHAFVQNLSRGHYELATNVDSRHRLTTAFAVLALAV